MVVAGVFVDRLVVVDFFADVRLTYRECLVYRMVDGVPSCAVLVVAVVLLVGVPAAAAAPDFFPTSRHYYREI